MATEELIQFIWKYSLYREKTLCTSCGQKMEILHAGEENPHAGPDFFNARIRLGGLIWAGNVEVHRRASDWYRHGHHLDQAYNNVILHVVEDHDMNVSNSLGRNILTLVQDFPESLIRRFRAMEHSASWLPCGEFLDGRATRVLQDWLPGLQKTRQDQHSHRMAQILNGSPKGLEEALYRALTPAYGIPVNSLPFELLVRKVPLAALAGLRDSVSGLEAMLFGQSGLLYPARSLGPYPSTLWQLYRENKGMCPSEPVAPYLWKFLRLRPPSFPTLRISQLASLIHLRYPLTESLIGADSLYTLEQALRTGASEYWTTHYLFGKPSPPIPKFTGEQFLATLIINVMVPFLAAMEKQRGRKSFGPRTDHIMQNLKAENNQILKNWGIFGIRARNALESQALLQLHHRYCRQKRCLECQIGAEIIQDAIHKSK